MVDADHWRQELLSLQHLQWVPQTYQVPRLLLNGYSLCLLYMLHPQGLPPKFL